jgi:hypothetical protein
VNNFDKETTNIVAPTEIVLSGSVAKPLSGTSKDHQGTVLRLRPERGSDNPGILHLIERPQTQENTHSLSPLASTH